MNEGVLGKKKRRCAGCAGILCHSESDNRCISLATHLQAKCYCRYEQRVEVQDEVLLRVPSQGMSWYNEWRGEPQI